MAGKLKSSCTLNQDMLPMTLKSLKRKYNYLWLLIGCDDFSLDKVG